jgi:hypothetical protein
MLLTYAICMAAAAAAGMVDGIHTSSKAASSGQPSCDRQQTPKSTAGDKWQSLASTSRMDEEVSLLASHSGREERWQRGLFMVGAIDRSTVHRTNKEDFNRHVIYLALAFVS